MGQCYSVEAVFLFKDNDSTSFCKAIKNYVTQHDGKGMRFCPHKDSDFDTPFGCFGVICPESYESDGQMSADFIATYGWEWVMHEIFTVALAECDDGSHVDVWPDNGMWSLSVRDGEVVEIGD